MDRPIKGWEAFMRNNQPTTFYEPHMLPTGEMGLTGREVAEALGVRYDIATEKLRRIDVNAWKSLGWNLTAFTVKSGGVGRPRIEWCLNTTAAKVFVTRWENERGNGYLSFLLTCEQVVMQELPKLKARYDALLTEAERMRGMLAAGCAPAISLPRPSTVLMPVASYMQPSLFGESPERIIAYRRVPKEKLTNPELREAKAQHLTRLMTGMAKEQKRLQEEIINDKLPAWARA